MLNKKLLGTAVVATFAVFAGTAAAQDLSYCKGLNGYGGKGTAAADANFPNTTWTAIAAATFQSRSVVKKCEVKDQIFDGKKGPPRFSTWPVATTNGDQCALYKMSASIDSLIRNGDKGAAYLEAVDLRLLADAKVTAGEVPAGGAALQAAAVAVEQCLFNLL